MYKQIVLTSIILVPLVQCDLNEPLVVGPGGIEPNEEPTCDDFSRFGRFNPYSVLDDMWFAFYQWADGFTPLRISFMAPTTKEIGRMREILDHHVTIPVDWSARLFVMTIHGSNETFLLVERDDRGQYFIYLMARVARGQELEPQNIRMKQTGDNRYIGLMKCDERKVYVLSRINDVPPKHKIQEAASTINYRARGGLSYLYQGHKWMPIPEEDDYTYWGNTNPELMKKWASQSYLQNPDTDTL